MPDDPARAPSHSRMDLAEDRTILASERTFAAWLRTALGCMALGIGSHALFNQMQPGWLPRLIATLFLLLAAAIVWLAVRRAAAVMRRLSPHVVASARKVNVELIASTVSICGTALVLAIWLLPIR